MNLATIVLYNLLAVEINIAVVDVDVFVTAKPIQV